MSELPLPPGHEPILELERTDIEFLVWQLIRPLGNVIVQATPGATEGDPGTVLTVTYLQVDCRAGTRQRAYSMADMARRRIKAMPSDEFPEVIISASVCTAGPQWEPDENGGPRYTSRYAISHHPRQGQLHHG